MYWGGKIFLCPFFFLTWSFWVLLFVSSLWVRYGWCFNSCVSTWYIPQLCLLNPLSLAAADTLCDSKWINAGNSRYSTTVQKLPGKQQQGSAQVLWTWCYSERSISSVCNMMYSTVSWLTCKEQLLPVWGDHSAAGSLRDKEHWNVLP